MRLKSRKRKNKQAKGSNNVENFALSHQKCVHELKSTSLLKFSLQKVEKRKQMRFRRMGACSCSLFLSQNP